MPSKSSNSSRSSSSSKASSSSNSSNSSRSMGKQSYQGLALIALIVMVFAIYYFTYKSNNDKFTNYNSVSSGSSGSSSSSGSTPNLKAAQGETVVALFYADWCPHCVAFKPDYTKAMSSLSGTKYKGKTLRLELVDCVANTTIATENSVSGFPTVKIFNDDKTSSEYKGDRTYEGLTSYFA